MLSVVRRALVAATVMSLGVALLGVPSSQASTGGDRFWAGQAYTGEFGAPSIIKVGDTYYAYATNGGGNNLPLLTSKDLKTWYSREAWPRELGLSDWAGYNDAMPFPAEWAAKMENGKPSIWAPAVIELKGRFVNAHAIQVRNDSPRRCLTLATSPDPAGPFRDTSRRPLYCSSDPNGSIDPAWLTVGRKVYLIWKNAGVPGGKPTQIMARRMTPNGLGFARNSRAHMLLQTAQPWEGNVIEAPSPVYYKGRLYLFYSGNIFTGSKYAIGYAVCKGPLGPCHRVRRTPLIASGGGIAGPGAQTPVVDNRGRLRLAYSAWRAGHVGYPESDACRETAAGCNQRRMYIATLGVGRGGKLFVRSRQ